MTSRLADPVSDASRPTVTAPSPLAAMRGRAVGWARRTEGRLALRLAMVVVLGLAAGLAGVFDVRDRAAVLGDVSEHSGPLTVAAVEVYRSLSDADATAASAFLAGGAEPAELRERYHTDIAAASAALNTAAAGARTEDSAAKVAQLTNYLPVYAGLVETARAYNRQGLPLGAAYLRVSSELVRSTLLPAARDLYRFERDRLASSQSAGGAVPWTAFTLGLLMIAALVVVQVYLYQRTRRMLNLGLLLATALTVGAVTWLGVDSLTSAASSDASRRDGAAQLEALAEARIAGLEARSDEALTLIARGNGAVFDEHFDATAARLTAGDGLLARARATIGQDETRTLVDSATDAAQRWLSVHGELRRLDREGGYSEAVRLATGTDAASTASLAQRFDAQLGQAMEQSRGRFDGAIRGARDALSGTDIALATLIALAVVAAAAGMWRRIAEYR